MALSTLALILVSVTMSAFAQIAFKFGVTAAREGSPDASVPGTLLSFLLSPGVIAGLALYGVGTLLWLNVLSRVEVSQAYPFVGLGFVLTAILGSVLFGDTLTMPRIAGTMLVMLGIYMIARS